MEKMLAVRDLENNIFKNETLKGCGQVDYEDIRTIASAHIM